jgi:hypothetical protein
MWGNQLQAQTASPPRGKNTRYPFEERRGGFRSQTGHSGGEKIARLQRNEPQSPSSTLLVAP